MKYNIHDDVIKWKHFYALLAICAGNSPVTGEFPTQRPVTRCFDAFFDLRLNGWLSKQSWGWWFETPSLPLWHHSNANFDRACVYAKYGSLWWKVHSALLVASTTIDTLVCKSNVLMIFHTCMLICVLRLAIMVHRLPRSPREPYISNRIIEHLSGLVQLRYVHVCHRA